MAGSKQHQGTAFPADGLKDYMVARARLKLGKFGPFIQSLRIRLKGPAVEGREDWTACAITVGLGEGEPMLFERSAPLAQEAFDHSLGVAERWLRRTLQKRRHRSK